MDSVTVLATVTTLSGMLNALFTTMSSTAALQRIWQDAGLTDISLDSQLSALQMALTSIKDWMEQSSSFQLGLPELHHQLIMDLDRCIACCRLVIPSVDASVAELLQQNVGSRPSKFTLMRKGRKMKKIQAMIQQQTTALTLLLTACNVADIRQQIELLEKPQTRRVFKAMEDDTSSLFVHRDLSMRRATTPSSSSSMISSTSTFGGASRLLLKFDFDKQLFVSKVYDRWLRSSPKTTLAEQYEPSKQNEGPPNVETHEKFVVDINPSDVVETREKFSLLPPINTEDKYLVEDIADRGVETREKFALSDGALPPSEIGDKYLADDSMMTPSSTSPQTPTNTRGLLSKVKLQPLRLISPVHQKSESEKRSLAIDHALKEERKNRGPYEYKAMLIGSEARLHLLAAAKMRDRKTTYTNQELEKYRRMILENVRDCTSKLVTEVRRVQINPDARYFWAYVDLIERYCHDGEETSSRPMADLDKTFFDSLEALLQDRLVANLINRCSSQHPGSWPKSASYFFASISRISRLGYVPTQLDILYATDFSSTVRGNVEVEVRDGRLSASLLDIGGLADKSRKWTHHLRAARFVVLVVDLDQRDDEEKAAEMIGQLDTIVNSQWFAAASIILLLNIKMADRSPLPDAKAGNWNPNVSEVAKSVLARFKELDPKRLVVSPCDLAANSEAAIQFMFSALKESIIIETLESGHMMV